MTNKKSLKIIVKWDKKEYPAKLSRVNRRGATPVLQLRYDSSWDLKKKIWKTFIQSYVVLKSQKELFDINKEGRKHFRTKLEGGQQEVLEVEPISIDEFRFKVFIKINNEWNNLFERLAEENVFGWLFDKDKKYLISKSTKWIKAEEFSTHQHATNVIYYLAHTEKKLIYIGKAENLGKRVKPGKQHQKMPGDWDRFKFDVIKPEYSNILDKIEDHTIRAFASILRNEKNYETLEVSNYKLVNSNWRKL